MSENDLESNVEMKENAADAPINTNHVVNEENGPYSYLDRDFSSENYKIEIKNLPKYYGVNEFRKLLNEKLNLASNKIKIPRKNSPFVFVCFRNDEDRERALEAISKYRWKGKLLTAIKAKPSPDPLVKKRKNDEKEEPSKKVKVDDRPLEERLKSSTIPYCDVPYVEQLKQKQEHVKSILKKLGRDLEQNSEINSWLTKQKSIYDGLPCELLDIRSSLKYNGYRNKCEFTVGLNEETKLPTVGFRIGSYVNGITGVGPIDNLCHIPNSMKTAVKHFQDFLRAYDLEVYNPEIQTGHLRQLMIRSSDDQLMLVVGIHPQNLSPEKLAQVKQDIVRYFADGPGKEAKATSIYYQAITKKKSGEDQSFEHLHGDTHIYETILGLKFRISPEAFFQINTAGAEVLYKSAIELAAPTENSTVVDICCGTGTIGLCFAKNCNQILGLELVPQAIDDARENAKFNGIDNSQFFAGKAEEILGSVCSRAKNEDVVGIVDPPRAGLHQKAIVQLRRVKKMSRLVYIACNPVAASKNFIDLGRPTSKTMHGEPLVPVKAVAVDMFPHTKHCELIVYFERWDRWIPRPSSIEGRSVAREFHCKPNRPVLVIRKCFDSMRGRLVWDDLLSSKVTAITNKSPRGIKSGEDQSFEHLHGDTHIYETILGLKFRISPEAFFQINTAGAEVLYKSAIELAAPTENSTVVDICCGTGTIGLCFAKNCNQILGLELVPQAIDDARENAKFNYIDNSQFFAGKAEEILGSVCSRAKNEDVVGIVDPPRAGLHQKAIVQLRRVKKMSRLVYIACNPVAASKNFIDLGRPTSKTMHGEPLVSVKAVAVDMFPHTKHCELIVYFERWDRVRERSENST